MVSSFTFAPCRTLLGAVIRCINNLLGKDLFEIIISKIKPFLCEYFGLDVCADFELYQDFTVHYSARLDRRLDIHTDDSDITINICLKNNMARSGLQFYGASSTLFSETSNAIIDMELGQYDVLIHRGSHPHQVLSISSEGRSEDVESERVNLILWVKVK